MPTITFHPSGKTVTIPEGTRLSRACREAGLHLSVPCGEKGICGKCRIRIRAGATPADTRQKAFLPRELLDSGWRCACLVDVRDDLVVDEPDAGGDGDCIVTGFLVRDPDGGCDGGGLGLAVDLGTTTLAAALCDLRSGAVLASAGSANPQAAYGDDVVSRLEQAVGKPEHAADMRRLAMGAIEVLAARLVADAGGGAVLDRIAVGGNTVMQHLLLGLDIGPLAVAPFASPFTDAVVVEADAAGWTGEGKPRLLVLPAIGSYVGGDVTAGLLAYRVDELPGNTLFMDIGTNGEIVLAAGGRLYACAAAAGPAFEGARISRGMRARIGAIAGVGLGPEGELETMVLGGAPEAGICGTGLLDAAATLLDSGVMDDSGRLLEQDEVEELGLSCDMISRVGRNDSGLFFRLEKEVGMAGGVALTQRDLRELQLAKGAMAAGARMLLAEAGIAAEELDAVLLAGGFGCRLNPASALRIGLLPRGVAPDRVRAVGNASLAGTRLYLLSARERERADALRRKVAYVELSGREDFASIFAEEMLFP